MNLEKVIFGFFIILAMTLNFGFFVGQIDNPQHHLHYELYVAIVVNLIATVLKFGDRTQIGAIHLATSLVADLQLIAAAIIWTMAGDKGMQPEVIVIGGGVGTYFDRFGKILAAEIKKYKIPLVKQPVLRQAQRPEEAVVFGCYDLAKQEFAHV